ncbi:MAG: acyl-CoA reductase [Gemmatimonadota bacterium]
MLPLRLLDLTAPEMAELCAGLRAARSVLLGRRATELAELLGRVGARFLDDNDPLRREALARLPAGAGLSAAMAREVLDGMARDWLPERLRALLAAEFEDPEVLDRFRPGPRESVRALGPALTLHLGAGNVPGVSVTSLVRGLLVKSPVLLKPGRSDAVLPVLFARALADADPEVAKAVAVVYWPGGEGDAEAESLRRADLVVAYGGEAALRAVRDRLPVTTRFLPYHHRISFGVIAREAGEGGAAGSAPGVARVARDAARAAALFDRRGCVSPHLFYVEEGGEVAPREWARMIAEGLREVERELPSGAVTAGEASEVHQFRGTAELSAAAGSGVELHRDEGIGWTVIFDPDPAFEVSCPGRTVRVKPVHDVREIAELVRPYGALLQTVGFAGRTGAVPDEDERFGRLVEELGRAGAFRVCSFRALPWPPPWWHHDGSGPLRALVRWVEVEEGVP